MPEIADRYVEAADLSQGWLDTVLAIKGNPGDSAVHFITRILDPTTEQQQVRAAAQWLIDERNDGEDGPFWDIETTRNTIFPAAWAQRMAEPQELADYYRERYTKDDLLGFNENGKGTYFGRIVSYPRERGPAADQLTETVRKLRAERKGGQPKSSRYEINIYNERLDTSPMSFPCMAHLSMHLDDGALHAQVVYRNEYLVGRGYGNFLGVAELQAYIAQAAALNVGELIVMMGHVKLDSSKKKIGEMLDRIGQSEPVHS